MQKSHKTRVLVVGTSKEGRLKRLTRQAGRQAW